MRLLERGNDGELGFTKDLIGDDKVPPYAILSHTWQDGQEVTFEDWKSGGSGGKAGYSKIMFCAQQAECDGLRYFWVDTCCINKADPVELQDAINSMFRWYRDAARCYVFLSDVSTTKRKALSEGSKFTWEPAFRESRWFQRGWTLQELLAPRSVEFFSQEGKRLGDKQSLEQEVHEITGIAIPALQGTSLHEFSVDERLLWTKSRQTTRKEDKAYCLLGIFGIFMPLIYGEGEDNAIRRLRDEIDKATDRSLQRYLPRLPTATGASYDSHDEEHNARCLPNTRTALLETIAEWANSKDSKSIFWLSGMAGTGKSTIARTAARSFAEADQLGANFFFKRGEGERGNASRFFSTIAADLVAREPGTLPGIRKALDQDSSLSQRALKDQFEKLILHPLSGVQQTRLITPKLIVVVDALDECEREEDIRTILQLLTRTKDMRPVSLRVLVTSRPELHIRLGFKQMPNGTYQDLILHEVVKNTIEHDIRLFYEHELSVIRQARMLSPGWPTAGQIQALVDLAVPLFIFAATVCRYINTKGGHPEGYLNKVLQYQKSTFSQLDRTYLPILEQLLVEQDEDEKEAWLHAFRKVVGSIVVLESPLSIKSLANLLQVPKKEVECRLDALHSVLSVPDNKDAPVRLLHLSFRDFLVSRPRQGKSQFWVEEKDTHKQLATYCLDLMSNQCGLRQNICNLSGPGVLVSEVDKGVITSNLSPELQYACRYWVDHLKQGQQGIADGDATHRFLQEHLLHWLEAMSLIGELSRCIHLLNRLQNLAAVRSF